MAEISTLLLSILGAGLQGITGIGFSIVLMSFLPCFVSYTMAANMNRMLGLVLAVCGLVQWRKSIRWKLLLPPLLASLVFCVWGLEAFVICAEETLSFCLGILLLILVALTWIMQVKEIRIQPGIVKGLLFGSLAGFATGFFSILGPILAIYYMNTTEDTAEYKGTINMHYTILSVWNNLVFICRYGYSSREIMVSIPAAVGAVLTMLVVFGWKIGRQRETVLKLMLAATAVMAVSMLL